MQSDAQLANPLTKPSEKHRLEEFDQRGGKWRLVTNPQFLSAKKRKSMGLNPLVNRELVDGGCRDMSYETMVNPAGWMAAQPEHTGRDSPSV